MAQASFSSGTRSHLLHAVVRGNDIGNLGRAGVDNLRGNDGIKYHGRYQGYILLPVVLLISLVAAVAWMLNHASVLEGGVTNSVAESAQAHYAAQAGMQHALRAVQNSGCAGDLTLASSPLGPHSYQATVTTTGATTTTSYTVTVDRDTWLKESSPVQNNGPDSELSAKAAGGDNMRVLYHYDLGAIPAGASIGSATAWFYITSNDPDGAISVHAVTAAWDEATATWSTTATQFDSLVVDSIPAQASSGVWVQVNLASLVQSWVNGSPNNGIMLVASPTGNESKFTSREWPTGSQRPRLEVVATSGGAASPVTISATGTLANGVTRTLNRVDVPAYQASSSRTLQPGAALDDAEIWDQAPNNNYGNADETWVSSASSDTTRTLLRFNMGAIPYGAKILEATLSMRRRSGSGADQPVSAHRIRNSWSEDTVTWNDRETGTTWDTAGGDFDITAVATTPVGPVNQRYEWDVTPLAQGWVDGSYPNHGVAMVAAIAGMPGERFDTSDHADPTRWPSLSVTYACECGIACIAPQGAGNIVMIGDWVGLSPDSRDQEKEAIIESWGYEVDQWDDDFIWAIDFNIYDLVYVSETVRSTSVSGQLDWRSIGIVNEQGNLYNDLNMADADAQDTGMLVDVTDNSHFITSPFPLAPLQIYSKPMEMLTVAGNQAAGLQVLAEKGGVGSLTLLETGATSLNGPAAGRRVSLPLGRDTNSDFNWTYLNNNGRLLVQRAIQWGTGNTTLGPAPRVILSTATAATLGSLGFDDIDIADYDPDSDVASLFFEGATTTLGSDIDAVHVLWNGHIVLSTKDDATLGGLSFLDGDLVEYDPATDTAVLYFDESAFSANEDIVSVYVKDNGNILLSTDTDATLGGLSFTDNDVVEYIPATDTASLYFDGSTTTLVSDIDALHVLDTGRIVLSTRDNATLGGLSFSDGDLVEYNPATDNAILYFDEGLFSDDEDVISAHIGPGSGGGSAPGSRLLLVAVDPLNLTAQEDAKRTLIESWGYTVSVIGQSDSQVDFDAAVAVNDVVFITEDVASGTLGTKLVNASIGVVTEEDNLSDEFGMSAGINWESGTQVEINDNTHYITSPFPTGLLTIMTSAESVAYVTGAESPDLGKLASSTSGFGVVTLEAGAATYTGGFAAGRRVQLPWGNNDFDLNHLNTDGRTILQRAIEWGAGAGLTVPQTIMFVVPDATALTAQDTAKKALMESWGYSVALITAADSQANFDAVAAGADVAYISEEAVSSDTNTKLRDATIGVVSEETALTDEFGIAGVRTGYTGTDIEVVDTTHYITSVFAAGPLTIASAATALNRLTGSVAPGLDSLAESTGDPELAAIETGGLLYDSGTAAGRRVQLPWGPDAFDITLLTADGQTLMRRAIEWGAGAGAGSPAGPVAHWKLDDGAGTTAVDSEGGHDGTLTSGPVWVAGQIGDALDFDGVNDYVDVGTFDVSGSGLTMMGWFNADTLPAITDPRIISKASSTAEADAWWQLSILTTGTTRNIRLRTKAGGTTSTLIDSSTNLGTGVWYFAVGTYDAATGEMKLYLNGTEVASQSHPVGGAIDTNAAVPAAIGANGTAEQFFDGTLDDVRVYDRALGATEISGLYAAGSGGGGGGGGSPTIVEVRVAAGNDDAEERVSNGSMYLTSSDLELISDGSNAQLVGMRFTGVAVPNGATISNAWIQFKVDETNTGATSVNIQGESSDSAAQFTSGNSNISSRGRTTASVPWTPVSWTTVGEAGPDQRTPDISAVIQEIVSRPGWASGNDMVMIITGSGERTAESYNGDASGAALLHIEY